MEHIPYLIVLLMVVLEVVSVSYLQKKRKTLDLTTPAGAQEDKKLKTVIRIMVIYTFAMIPVLLYFLLPAFQPIAN